MPYRTSAKTVRAADNLSTLDGQGLRPVDQAIHGRDFWQADFDPTSRTWSLSYNVPVDTKDDRPGRGRLEFRKTE